MLISFDFHSFHFSDSSRSTEGYFRDPECVPRVLWRIFTVAFSFFTLFLFTPPPPSTCSSPSLPPPSHSSFLIAPPLPLSSLLCLVRLPCHTEVRVRGQLPGKHQGAHSWRSSRVYAFLLIFLFNNSFPQEMASLSPVVTHCT